MNRGAGTAVALTLVLAACATSGGKRIFTEAEPRLEGFTLSAFVSAPNPTAPNVFITSDKRIVVDQEPIYPPPGDQVTIYFGLQEGGPYEFANNGIEIRGNPRFCETKTKFIAKCSYRRPAAGTEYKYKVMVKPRDGGPPIRDLDPTIMN